jgi:hypothetical protein
MFGNLKNKGNDDLRFSRIARKRWHEEYPRTHREWRKHYLFHVESNISYNRAPGRDPDQFDCICDQQKGRFRKKDAWDCGHTQCYLCHSDKFPKRETTLQEDRSELKLREGIEEFLVDLLPCTESICRGTGLIRSSRGSAHSCRTHKSCIRLCSRPSTCDTSSMFFKNQEDEEAFHRTGEGSQGIGHVGVAQDQRECHARLGTDVPPRVSAALWSVSWHVTIT